MDRQADRRTHLRLAGLAERAEGVGERGGVRPAAAGALRRRPHRRVAYQPPDLDPRVQKCPKPKSNPKYRSTMVFLQKSPPILVKLTRNPQQYENLFKIVLFLCVLTPVV